MIKNTRFYYLDVLKFLAMVFVCCYHFNVASNLSYADEIFSLNTLNRFLYGLNSVCIPIFFMVNGALLLNKELNVKKHLKRTAIIFFQYFFWRFVTILIIAKFNNISLSSIGLKIVFTSNIPGIDLNHLWFIPTLLCIYLIFPFIYGVFKDFNKDNTLYLKVFVGVLVFLCFFSRDFNVLKLLFEGKIKNINFSAIEIFNPFRGLVGSMIVYFIIGGYIHKNIEKFKKIKFRFIVPVFITGLLVHYFKWRICVKDTGNLIYDNIVAGYYSIPILLVSISLFLICLKINNKKIDKHPILCNILDTVGKNTLAVYYFHWIFGYTILVNYYDKYIGLYGLTINFIRAIIIVIAFSYVGKLIKKIPIIKKTLN